MNTREEILNKYISSFDPLISVLRVKNPLRVWLIKKNLWQERDD